MKKTKETPSFSNKSPEYRVFQFLCSNLHMKIHITQNKESRAYDFLLFSMIAAML